MNDKKIILAIIILTIAILGGGVYILSATNTPKIIALQNAKAYVENSTSLDFGTIPINKGNLTKSFIIKNTGTDTLKLYNIKTSCHCTTAQVSINGSNSPSFGMDSLSSWVGEVRPGKEAKLNIIFDPAFHGDSGLGPINRFVSVETNDKSNAKLTFTITGNVIK